MPSAPPTSQDAELLADVCDELVTTYGAGGPAAVLLGDRLTLLTVAELEVNRLLTTTVADARKTGASWAFIGRAVGTSAAGAHRRWRDHVGQDPRPTLLPRVRDIVQEHLDGAQYGREAAVRNQNRPAVFPPDLLLLRDAFSASQTGDGSVGRCLRGFRVMELEVNRLLARTAAALRAEGASWRRISDLSGKAEKGAWLRWHNADTVHRRPAGTQPSREIGLD